jgi:predicted dehydrogenase
MTQGGGLLINGVKNGRQYTLTPALGAGGVAFYDGSAEKPEDLEAQTFAKAVRGQGKLYVLPEEAAGVTQILEGIYDSAKTGKPHYF